MKFSVLLLIILILSGCVGGGLGGIEVRDQTELDASSFNQLTIITASAPVTIRTGQADKVKANLEGTIRITNGDQNARLRLKVVYEAGVAILQPQFVGGVVTSYSGEPRLTLIVPDGFMTQVSVKTASGDIDVRGLGRGLQLESSSGDVKAALSRNASFDLSGRVGSGKLFTSLPISWSGRNFSGKLNGGGSEFVYLVSSSGNIVIVLEDTI